MIKRRTINELLLENKPNIVLHTWTQLVEYAGLFFKFIKKALEQTGNDDFLNLKSFLNAKPFGISQDYMYVEVDRLFYASYAQRRISPLLDTYRTDLDGNVLKFDDYSLDLGRVLVSRFGERWDRYIEELGIEYNPIHNYDMTEDENVNTDMTTALDNTNSVSGFNSSTLVDNSKDEGSSHTTGDFSRFNVPGIPPGRTTICTLSS